MGNRAVITSSLDLGTKDTDGIYKTEDGVELQDRKDKIGIYLHWNGGYDSVKPFLVYCKAKQYRDPTNDASYAFARLIQVISNYFGGELSIGVDTLNHLDCDNYDNGVYIIGAGWEIIDRQYFTGSEQKSHDLKEMLIDINKAQPEQFTMDEIEEIYNKEMKGQ